MTCIEKVLNQNVYFEKVLSRRTALKCFIHIFSIYIIITDYYSSYEIEAYYTQKSYYCYMCLKCETNDWKYKQLISFFLTLSIHTYIVVQIVEPIHFSGDEMIQTDPPQKSNSGFHSNIQHRSTFAAVQYYRGLKIHRTAWSPLACNVLATRKMIIIKHNMEK